MFSAPRGSSDLSDEALIRSEDHRRFHFLGRNETVLDEHSAQVYPSIYSAFESLKGSK